MAATSTISPSVSIAISFAFSYLLWSRFSAPDGSEGFEGFGCLPRQRCERSKPGAVWKCPYCGLDRVRRTKETPTVNRGKTPPTEPLRPGERRTMLIMTGVVAAVIAAGAVTAWAMTSHSSTYERSRDDCVNVSIASSMGGALEHACGAAARDWCRAVNVQHDAHAQAVQAQCRAAGILP
jgi:hypothetical protein